MNAPTSLVKQTNIFVCMIIILNLTIITFHPCASVIQDLKPDQLAVMDALAAAFAQDWGLVCTEILYTLYISRITICHGPEVPITANHSHAFEATSHWVYIEFKNMHALGVDALQEDVAMAEKGNENSLGDDSKVLYLKPNWPMWNLSSRRLVRFFRHMFSL